jgi:hypothetical protein
MWLLLLVVVEGPHCYLVSLVCIVNHCSLLALRTCTPDRDLASALPVGAVLCYDAA